MASRQMHVILSIIVGMALAVHPTVTMAKEFIVGDDSGWTINFDYQTWAAGKDFRVGDKLVHNVFKVNGTAFRSCTVPPASEALTSGKDTIILATPGRKWYICGMGKHCAFGGQKLAITVLDNIPAPSPAPAYAGKEAWSPLQPRF